MSEQITSGGCQCGAIRYELHGEPVMAAICHCSMCRHANAAPAVAWVMIEETKLVFVKGQPKIYESSDEARRGFCPECGTQLSFTASYLPGLIDITIGSLDCPEAMEPALHYWDSKRLPWVKIADDLPKHHAFPPME